MIKKRIKKTAVAGMVATGAICFLWADISYGGTVKEADIRDTAFFHCILIYDRDQDGVLSEAEREAVTVLNVSGKGIASMEGIGRFPRLDLRIADERPDSQMVYQRVSEICETRNHMAYLPGYPDGSFRPEAGVTRADLAAILYGILTDAQKERLGLIPITVPDLAADAWYTPAVRTMRAAGILRTEADGNFYPAHRVTRAELAEILDRYEAGAGAGIDYPDTAVHPSALCIRRIAAKGWMQPDPDGNFYPDRGVTRAEVAAALNRMLGRKPQMCEGIRGRISYTDVTAEHRAYADLAEASVSHTPDPIE